MINGTDFSLNSFDNFLKRTTMPSFAATEGEDPFAAFRKKRRKRRGEPRKSARGNITRFEPYGRYIKCEFVKSADGRPQVRALHATKGWRRLPVGFIPPGWQMARQ